MIFHVAYIVREDAHLLFGFLSIEEKELFEQLTLVSGVGPKTGVSLLGHLEINDLKTAILNGNTTILAKVPGVGKKTSERLIVELKDKLGLFTPPTKIPTGGNNGDAVSALINLGYHPLSAQKAVNKVLESSPDLELSSLISQALRFI